MSLKTDIDQLVVDAALVHSWAHGSSSTSVTMGGAPVCSPAKLIADQNAAIEAAFVNFYKYYLGPKSSAPTTDNSGNPLLEGAMYFNTTSDAMQVWTGAAWVNASAGAGYVAKTGDAMTGELTLAGDPTLPLHAVPLQTLEGYFGRINHIGTPGHPGFGVGICPALPAGVSKLPGTDFPQSDEYGNYRYTDGSIMCWIPAFFYKYGTGSNGLAVNILDIKAESAYPDVATANAAGYALDRAFYDGGAVQRGFFQDKYKCSNNSGTASSIKNGNPLSSNAANNPFSGLTGAPADFYYGAIAAAKTRGANFFPSSLFINKALARLALAHAQASTSTTWCAWYHATNNFPKGCNNNALGDAQDGALTFTSAGNGTYPNANKTGSANVLAKTTHNGQNCGVADVNGTIWEICLGLTSNGTNIYILKTSAAMKDITAGTTLATDAWGATGIAALYDDLDTTYGALWATGANRLVYFGAATQVFSEAVSGNAWNAAGAGVPLAGGIGGTNAFGNDGLWDYKPNEMCPIAAGGWGDSSPAGAWALNLATARGASAYYVGFRAALYL